MSTRLIVIPRWGGTPDSDWYPWAKRELAAAKPAPFDPVIFADMPHPELPTIAAWVNRVQSLLGSDPDLNANTVLVGHSVGCQAIMRALAGRPAGVRVAGLFFVAAWFSVDAPWEPIMPWIETPIDTGKVREAADKIVVVISDDDHHRKDWRSNRQVWEERVGASVSIVPGADHFNGPAYPALLDILLKEFGGRDRYVHGRSIHGAAVRGTHGRASADG